MFDLIWFDLIWFDWIWFWSLFPRLLGVCEKQKKDLYTCCSLCENWFVPSLVVVFAENWFLCLPSLASLDYLRLLRLHSVLEALGIDFSREEFNNVVLQHFGEIPSSSVPVVVPVPVPVESAIVEITPPMGLTTPKFKAYERHRNESRKFARVIKCRDKKIEQLERELKQLRTRHVLH